MKKLLLLLFVTILNHSVTKAQCPSGANAIKSAYSQCASGCGVLLFGWPSGVVVNVYGGSPISIITSAVISGTLGSGQTGNALICVPDCNTPLLFASTTTGATSGCVITVIGTVAVKLNDFSAVSSGNKNTMLKWTGANEVGDVKYTVQRSIDGKNFIDLKTINAENNGKASNTYSFTDDAAIAGNNHYRIKIAEVSGSISYSETNLVKKQTNFSVSIYPNPVNNNFKVTIPQKFLPATVEVVNAQGMVVYKSKTTLETLNITKNLQRGTYALKVTGSNNETITQKVIKQ